MCGGGGGEGKSPIIYMCFLKFDDILGSFLRRFAKASNLSMNDMV